MNNFNIFPTYIQDIDINIMVGVNDITLMRLFSSNKYLYNISSNNSLWKIKLESKINRKFAHNNTTTLNLSRVMDYKEVYKKIIYRKNNWDIFQYEKWENWYYKSCQFGYIEIVKYLFDFHTNSNIYLFQALISRNIEVIRFFVEKGANIHEINCRQLLDFNNTNLYILKYLQEKGLNLAPTYILALVYSPKHDLLDTLKFLVKECGVIHTSNNFALIESVKYGKLDLLKYLIEQGEDIHMEEDLLLINAAKYGHLDIIKYLLDQQLAIESQDYKAIKEAEENGHTIVVKYLEKSLSSDSLDLYYLSCNSAQLYY